MLPGRVKDGRSESIIGFLNSQDIVLDDVAKATSGQE
jgi:hypothetical protein